MLYLIYLKNCHIRVPKIWEGRRKEDEEEVKVDEGKREDVEEDTEEVDEGKRDDAEEDEESEADKGAEAVEEAEAEEEAKTGVEAEAIEGRRGVRIRRRRFVPCSLERRTKEE